MTVVEQEVASLERQRFDAQVKKDFAFLEKVFANDLVYTHSNGHEDNKTEYLQSIRDGKSRYDAIEVRALNVRAYHDGSTAVVNGTIAITMPAGTPDGALTVIVLKYVTVHVKHSQQGWQVVLWQSQKQLT